LHLEFLLVLLSFVRHLLKTFIRKTVVRNILKIKPAIVVAPHQFLNDAIRGSRILEMFSEIDKQLHPA